MVERRKMMDNVIYTIYEIRRKRYCTSEGDEVMYANVDEAKAREAWENRGYKSADDFGLYRVSFELVDGKNVM
jgi:hypothetical protein